MGLTDTEKVELGSAGWVDVAAAFLREAVAVLGDAVRDVRFSMCEVFTAAPASIADDDGRAAWWFRIDGASVDVGLGARDDVEVRVEVDHEDTLPWARLVYDMTDPEVVAALQQRAEERKAALGTDENPLDRLPPELRRTLTALHNHLAPRTA